MAADAVRTNVRSPQEIINALATRRGLVTPVPAYFPLGAGFTAECVREAYRDAMDAVTEAARVKADQPEAVAALRLVLDRLAAGAAEA